MQCPRCLANVSPDVKFCPECGAALNDDAAAALASKGLSRTAPAVADEAERNLWEGGYSPKAMIGVWVTLAIVSFAILGLAVILTTAGTLGVGLPVVLPVVLGIILVIWLIGGVTLLIRRWSVHYSLTSQRFIHRYGILKRTTDRIELIDVDDISFQQGLIERMVGVGTIQVKSSDVTHPELILRGIDPVQQIADTIDNARRQERRRRGIHIETV